MIWCKLTEHTALQDAQTTASEVIHQLTGQDPTGLLSTSTAEHDMSAKRHRMDR